jgi:hypothetical protein
MKKKPTKKQQQHQKTHNMKTFNDLQFKPINDFRAGVQATINFQNGYGASIVQHSFSYGHEDGLYELAVLDEEGGLTYNTSVTNDVLGWLTEDDVTEALIKIQNL